MTVSRKVLVIDDDPVVGKSIDRVLAAKGYAVISAAGGAEALERIAKEDYDVVYADIRMPGMDGLEVARRIKAARPWLPVVIVTGYGTQTNEAQAREIGVSDFLRKPLSPEMIEASAESSLPEKARFMPVPVDMPALPESQVAPAAPAEGAGVGRFAKNVALFFAAPFIGLAYLLVGPFVGLGILGWVGYQALKKKGARPQGES